MRQRDTGVEGTQFRVVGDGEWCLPLLGCYDCVIDVQIWRTLDFLLQNLESKCPQQLKEHLLDVESRFITLYVWSSDGALLNYVNKLGSEVESAAFQVITYV